MVEQKASSIRVTNQQRIIRIFRKICQSKLFVFIRAEQGSNIVVKGRASDLDFIANASSDEQDLVFVIGGLSGKGISYLSDKNQVQIEFVMTSSRIVGLCHIVRRGPNFITLTLPASLVTVERRQGARHKTRADLAAFAAFSLWEADERDYVSPPFFRYQEELARMVPLADVSIGGFCLATRFPSLSRHLTPDTVDPQVKLYLPMAPPVLVSINVRWVKKRIEHLASGNGSDSVATTFLIGCMFNNPADSSYQQQVTRFMQQLIEAEAI